MLGATKTWKGVVRKESPPRSFPHGGWPLCSRPALIPAALMYTFIFHSAIVKSNNLKFLPITQTTKAGRQFMKTIYPIKSNFAEECPGRQFSTSIFGTGFRLLLAIFSDFHKVQCRDNGLFYGGINHSLLEPNQCTSHKRLRPTTPTAHSSLICGFVRFPPTLKCEWSSWFRNTNCGALTFHEICVQNAAPLPWFHKSFRPVVEYVTVLHLWWTTWNNTEVRAFVCLLTVGVSNCAKYWLRIFAGFATVRNITTTLKRGCLPKARVPANQLLWSTDHQVSYCYWADKLHSHEIELTFTVSVASLQP